MRVWRLTGKPYASTAFSGIGNRKVGSRWVPEGLLAVYTSEYLSTAILENLVHMRPEHFRDNHVVIAADIPDDISMDVVSTKSLPDGWRTLYESPVLQQVGQEWIERGESAVLVVPSAVVPQERNAILNPEHPEFERIVIHETQQFDFDGRLFP